ncbi:hypothetical protein [Tenacibaculum halocynthiae]|uniref:hypothetical protein n=1 Tax=Tenacibaculum halocynthiae TaxID=1254437 RepID=UPI003D65C120
MKKQILNLGKPLTKEKQVQINGGRKQCKPHNICIDYGRHCAELECVFGPF